MIISEMLDINISYIIIGMAAVLILVILFLIILAFKFSKLKKLYKKFMSGSNGESLESEIIGRFTDIDNIKIELNKMSSNIKTIEETLLNTYQKIGIVKYDAFKEMGGKLSFAIALLNDTNDGFILNSMHSSREGCYTYIKEIIKGESFIMLAEEEKEALEIAKKSRKLI